MLLKQMRYFISIVENNSFTEAAEACYISQSAISQQMKALEEDLGVTLFLRENRKFSLTPAGEHFYRQSRLLIDEVERLRMETIHIAGNEASKLRIGYLNSYKGQELQQAIALFSAQHPQVDLEITSGNHEGLYDLLRTGQCDVILSDQRRAFSDEYDNMHLFTCLCYAEISSRSPLTSFEAITLEELKRVPCILIACEDQRANEQDYYGNTLGFSGNFLFAENMDEGRLLVAANKGFMPIEALANTPSVGAAICQIPLMIGENPLRRGYYLFAKKKRSNPHVAAFAEILKTLFPQTEE